MFRTTSERYVLNAVNRHMATRRNRHTWRRRLAQVCHGTIDWFTAWWI